MTYKVIDGKLVKIKKTKPVVAGTGLPPRPSSPERSRRREEQAPRLAADKGEFGGSCNITHCQRPNSATWYNHSTRKYYCRFCAHDLNYDHFNRKDAMDMWGHLLCTEGKVIESNDYQAIHDHYRKLHESYSA